MDADKVKEFWDSRAKKYGTLDFNSIGNLEEDPANLALKVRLEQEMVFGYVGSVQGLNILDLGAGIGQWAFRFAERGAKHVTGVEYSEQLANIGRQEARARGITNVEFIVSPAEAFRTDKKFDLVYVAGLFVCMTDEQAEKVVAMLPAVCHPKTRLVIRDGTGVPKRHEINNRFSQHLQAYYSGTYRTAEEYEALFARHGFAFVKHANMFPEDCVLNKYPETRLRIYDIRVA